MCMVRFGSAVGRRCGLGGSGAVQHNTTTVSAERCRHHSGCVAWIQAQAQAQAVLHSDGQWLIRTDSTTHMDSANGK